MSERVPISRDDLPSRNGARNVSLSPLAQRDTGRVISTSAPPPPMSPTQLAAINSLAVQNAGKTVDVPWNPYRSNQATTVTPLPPNNTFYGTGDPFLVLSDVFRNVFGSGGDVGQSKQTGQALVPVTSSSGGGSAITIVIILAVVGVGVYLYYRNR